jgi:Ca2+-transporting ATPase
MAFNTLAMAQIFHLGNARSGSPVLAPRRAAANGYALAAVALSVSLQVLVVQYAPLSAVLSLTPLTLADWATAVALGAAAGVVGQIIKTVTAAR